MNKKIISILIILFVVCLALGSLGIYLNFNDKNTDEKTNENHLPNEDSINKDNVNNIDEEEDKITETFSETKQFFDAGILLTSTQINKKLDFDNSLTGEVLYGTVIAKEKKITFKQDCRNVKNYAEEYDIDYDGCKKDEPIENFVYTLNDKIISIKMAYDDLSTSKIYLLTDKNEVYEIDFNNRKYVCKENFSITKYANNVKAISIYGTVGNDPDFGETESVALKKMDDSITVNGENINKYLREVHYFDEKNIIFVYNKNNEYIKSYDFMYSGGYNVKGDNLYLIKDENGKALENKQLFQAFRNKNDDELTTFILSNNGYLYYLLGGFSKKYESEKYSEFKVESIKEIDFGYEIIYENGKKEQLLEYYEDEKDFEDNEYSDEEYL